MERPDHGLWNISCSRGQTLVFLRERCRIGYFGPSTAHLIWPCTQCFLALFCYLTNCDTEDKLHWPDLTQETTCNVQDSSNLLHTTYPIIAANQGHSKTARTTKEKNLDQLTRHQLTGGSMHYAGSGTSLFQSSCPFLENILVLAKLHFPDNLDKCIN